MDRFVIVWNSFAGVAGFATELKPVEKFQNCNIAVARIWKAFQRLNGDATPEETPAAETAKAAPTGAKRAPSKGKLGKKATPAKKSAQNAIQGRQTRKGGIRRAARGQQDRPGSGDA